MSSSAPSLRELTATVPLGAEGDEDDAATRRWARERWAAIHERAKKLAEENESRRASLPSVPPPPSSRSGPRSTLQRRRFASESTQEALRAMRRNFSSAPPPPSEPEPRLSRRWLTIAAVVLAVDLALVVGSVIARHGWPF
jgi:hypothetical protein